MSFRTSLLALSLIAASASPPAAQQVRVLVDPDHSAWSTTAPDLFRVRFETSRGDFVLEVNRRWAPIGVDRLYNLVRHGFYDDTRFYRVREGFIAQFGLSGDPAINAAWYGRTMADDPVRRSNARGTVAYAMLETPGSRTTQLYVNLEDNGRLDAQGFAPVARVVEGMDVVDALYAGYDEGAGGGMRGGNQGRIVSEGNAHLDRDFPELDRIVRATVLPGSVMRYPNVGANRIRVEAHLLPPVSTGPMHPTWSPDGEWLAFAARGDIWKVPAGGGEAVALTRGPHYHSEPAWSPDGTQVAYTVDRDGNLDVGIVTAEGADARLVTTHPAVDVQPNWVGEAALLFSSARDGDFDIYFAGVQQGDIGGSSAPDSTKFLGGRGHEIQPEWKLEPPDALSLDMAYIGPAPGRPGVGGIWRKKLDAVPFDDPEYYEELSYRAEPDWRPGASSLAFVSDAAGSDDLALLRIGGSTIRLTDDDGDEHSPAFSPDGSRIAFVSNRTGPTRLFTMPAGGARRAAWDEVRIASWRPQYDAGRLRVRVLDEIGVAVPARIVLVASDGRAYTPDGGFHRTISATDTHYFHGAGEFEVTVPAGPVWVEAIKGFEYAAAVGSAEVPADGSAQLDLRLRRLADAPARGWYSGETHAHDLHQGRFGLDHERFFLQLVAEDLHVTNALIHMDGTRIMGRWADLTGEPHPLSTGRHMLQYAQEFRGSFGHVGMLGVSEFVTPLISGTAGTPFDRDVLNLDYLDAARAQGGIGGFMHPYSRPVMEPADGASSEIALDVALGKGEFYDVANIWYDELGNAEMYYRFLNAGFDLAATGGSDNFADVWRDPPPGTTRTYARIEGQPSVPAWLRAIEGGRTFATSAPLLFVEASLAGTTFQLGDTINGKGGDRIGVAIDVVSGAPLDLVEVLKNGQVVESFDVRDRGATFRLESTVPLLDGGWLAVRAVGPPGRHVTDSYAFAQTSPIYLEREGRRWRSAADARFLAETVRALWRRVAQRDRFTDDAARQRYERLAQEAIDIYETIAREEGER